MELRHSAQKIQVVVTMKDIFNALLKLSGQGFAPPLSFSSG